MIHCARNKLEILDITDSQIYTKTIYRIENRFNDWVQECIMYPTNLDAIYWEVIDFIDIISNINNMDLQSGPMPPSFRTFDSTETKTTKGYSNDGHSDQPSRKNIIKRKASKVQNKSTLSEWRLRDTEDIINFSGKKVCNQPKHAYLQW